MTKELDKRLDDLQKLINAVELIKEPTDLTPHQYNWIINPQYLPHQKQPQKLSEYIKRHPTGLSRDQRQKYCLYLNQLGNKSTELTNEERQFLDDFKQTITQLQENYAYQKQSEAENLLDISDLFELPPEVPERVTTPQKPKLTTKPKTMASASSAVTKSNNLNISLLSSLDVKNAVTTETIQRYKDLVEQLLVKSNPTDDENSFMLDYFRVINKFKSLVLPDHVSPEAITSTTWKDVEVGTINKNKLVTEPAIFDGKHPRPRDWLEDFVDAIESNQWTDAIVVKYFKTWLTGAAKDWFITDVRPSMTPQTKFSDIREKFVKQYLSDDKVRLMHYVESLYQRPDEGIALFLPKFRRAMLMSEPLTSESEQIRRIIEKLRPEYRKDLILANPTTFSKLHEICVRLEMGWAATRANKNNREREQNYNLQNQPKPRVKFNDKAIGQDSSANLSRFEQASTPKHFDELRQQERMPVKQNYNLNSPDKDSMNCFKCNRNNHWASECRANFKLDGTPINKANTFETTYERNYRNLNTNRQNITAIQHECKENEDAKIVKVIRESKRVNVVRPINLVVNKESNIEQPVVVNNIPLMAMVDTGAYVSVVDADLVTKYGWKVEHSPTQLIGADGNKLKSKGMIIADLSMKINKVTKSTTHHISVVENLSAPMLLGLKLMKAFKLHIDTDSFKLKFKDEFTKPGKKSIKDKNTTTRAIQTINGLLDTKNTNLEMPPTRDDDILITNTIANVVNNETRILIMNLSHKPELSVHKTPNKHFEPTHDQDKQAQTIDDEINSTDVAESLSELETNLTPKAELSTTPEFTQTIATNQQKENILSVELTKRSF